MGILKTDTERVRLGWRILLFLALFIVFSLPASLIPFPGVPGDFFSLLVATLLASWVLLRMDGRGLGALGFYLSPSAVRESALGLGLGIGGALVVILGMAALGGIRWSGQGGAWGAALLTGGASFWLFTIPAAAEEALVRGYFFQALVEKWGPMAPLWATSILFGFMHIGNPNWTYIGVANIAVAGLFLGVIYLKTASLWWASGAHLGWNWAQGFLTDLPVSGTDMVDNPLMEAHFHGSELVSGGAFGPEASVVATVIVGLASLLLWKTSLLSPGESARNVRPLILASEESSSSVSGNEGASEFSDPGRNQ